MKRQSKSVILARTAPMVLAMTCGLCTHSATFNKEFTLLALDPPGDALQRVANPERAEGQPSFVWPVRAVLISSGFGPRWGDHHMGIDLAAQPGTPIIASADGVVIYAGYQRRGYGNLVVIEHDEQTRTVYAHNRRLLVQKGQRVKQGQMIALMGRTGFAFGTHVHFEYRIGGHPVDPELYLDPLCFRSPAGAPTVRCEELASL